MVPTPVRPDGTCAASGTPGSDAAMAGHHMDEDLMTRRQVALLFRVTSATVATWARRGRLPQVRNEAGRPRYRRGDVEALFRSEFGVAGPLPRHQRRGSSRSQ
jgi:Helix-turn-helix domain